MKRYKLGNVLGRCSEDVLRSVKLVDGNIGSLMGFCQGFCFLHFQWALQLQNCSLAWYPSPGFSRKPSHPRQWNNKGKLLLFRPNGVKTLSGIIATLKISTDTSESSQLLLGCWDAEMPVLNLMIVPKPVGIVREHLGEFLKNRNIKVFLWHSRP